ncbi:hypothetical protein [Streptomyces malaysiensis]|uniref:hypothetical protein n=1 Tax=Streptomyces malaysiensis TaxID=92644 RepID=UPI00114D0964|nr:hypothetical protein [Streptomyces sp. SPMA113]
MPSVRPSRRGAVLVILGVITLGVAILSVAVSYQILEPRFGAWAVPTVGSLDALWCVFQATEILAGNNRRRVLRVQVAGVALTVVNAAIPTAHLILSGSDGFDLAFVLTPVAIVLTKCAWWIALPSLGRKVSAGTRQDLDIKRQEVADRLEQMESEAANRLELLRTATSLEKRVSKAETRYRKSQLKLQQTMTEELHEQAKSTQKTVSEKALPASVAAIPLPELDTWTPTAPALPVTAGRDASGTGTPVLPAGGDASGTEASGSHAGQEDDADGRDGSRNGGGDGDRAAVTLADLAAVTGVPVPQPGEQLTQDQIGVVLRHLRYSDDPPMSYRQARDSFRRAGYVGSEERIRRAWTALMANEGHSAVSEDTGSEDETEDQDA